MKMRLTPADLDEMIVGVEYLRPENSTLTVCVLTLNNGCTLTGTSNVIDPANYDQELGEQASFSNAKGKIWEVEGYALKRDIHRSLELAAMTAHEVNRAYCTANGDLSQPKWDDAPDWQKDSARLGVLHIKANPDSTPDASHESWLAQKVKDGWVYGPKKDAEAKTHPCMVPYDQLPFSDRVKDYLFGGVVRALTS